MHDVQAEKMMAADAQRDRGPFASHADYSALLLRIGLAGVFLWFGIDKVIHALNWSGWMPGWLMQALPINVMVFIRFMGAFEALLGLCLLVGFWTRLAAALAAMNLAAIIASFGLNDVMIRDAGLLFLAMAIAVYGSGRLGIDANRHKRRME